MVEYSDVDFDVLKDNYTEVKDFAQKYFEESAETSKFRFLSARAAVEASFAIKEIQEHLDSEKTDLLN